MEYQPKRLFTVDEANRTLPLVQRIARDVVAAFGRAKQARDQLEDRLGRTGGSLDAQYSDEVMALQDTFQQAQQDLLGFAGELDQLGVLLKGVDVGLVDFPAKIDGKVVFLCWKLGEPAVEYWHEIDSGFLGRQPLDSPLTAGR